MMHSPFIWCTDNSSLTDVGFGSLTYQSLTGVAFASLTLIWCRSCIWFVVVTMMHWRIYANWRRCCSKTKENIDKHSSSLEELTVFTLLESNTLYTYLSVQILDEILKKKESYKQHCQAEALCKFDCCRPMNWLYVDLDIDHRPDSAILIFHPCHWTLLMSSVSSS